MRTLPVRLISSQVDSFFGCARAGTDAATVTAAAMAVADATSRRRIPIFPSPLGPCSSSLYRSLPVSCSTLEEARALNLGAALRLRQERTQIASQSTVIPSVARDLSCCLKGPSLRSG